MIRLILASMLIAAPALAQTQPQGGMNSLSTSEQQKPAVQPQNPVPGPTPQEVSREAKPEEKTDARKTEHQGADTSSHQGSTGSSAAPSTGKKP